MAKKETSASVSLRDPAERKKFKSALSNVTHQFQMIDDRKESIKGAIAEMAAVYGLDKKLVRKIATTMYKHSYADVVEENRHFEELYESIVDVALAGTNDPLDDDEDDEDEGSGSGSED